MTTTFSTKKAAGTATVAAALCLAALPATTTAKGSATPKKAFDAYNAALNKNDVKLLMTRVTDDIVWMPQQRASIVGKKQAAKFVTGRFAKGKITFKITSVESVVTGKWAYNRYVERLTLTDEATGEVVKSWRSKGLMILRKGKDGTWLVARDSFSDDS